MNNSQRKLEKLNSLLAKETKILDVLTKQITQTTNSTSLSQVYNERQRWCHILESILNPSQPE